MVTRKGLVKVLLPRLADRGDELGVALGVAVVSVAGLGVAEGRVDDGLVGRKVRVADAQVDNVLVFGQRSGVERQAGARALEALGNKVSLHGCLLLADRRGSPIFQAARRNAEFYCSIWQIPTECNR